MYHQITSSRAATGRTAAGRAAIAFVTLLMPLVCFAHPGHDLHPGLLAGFIHPFSGLDHLLAMIAVGLWAAQLGGRALWMLPATFITAMLAGAAVALSGVAIDGAESMIVASVLALGLLIVLFARVSVVTGAMIVASFAFFHGYAHGVELPAATSAVSYMTGFAIATAVLHLIGVGIAIVLSSQRSLSATRWAGALTLLGGVTLLY